MISKDESIPKRTSAYLAALDIFYIQFNDVFFYIEDSDQENLYFSILKKLFPEIKLNKIFPLGGKKFVIDEAKKNVGNKKKIFIVDKDFDDLLGKIVNQDNLFYLNQYSIENFIIEKEQLRGYIIEESPKIRANKIDHKLQFENCCKRIVRLYYLIILRFILIQELDLGIENASIPIEKFVFFKSNSHNVENIAILEAEIQAAIIKKNKRYKLANQLKRLRKRLGFKTRTEIWPHIPGKYILKYFKFHVENVFGTPSQKLESFVYRLTVNNRFNSLHFLRDRINDFIAA
jgi:hypothetical protein